MDTKGLIGFPAAGYDPTPIKLRHAIVELRTHLAASKAERQKRALEKLFSPANVPNAASDRERYEIAVIAAYLGLRTGAGGRKLAAIWRTTSETKRREMLQEFFGKLLARKLQKERAAGVGI